MTEESLRSAIEASRRWYDGVFALHGIPVSCDGRLWVALGSPPPWHSAVKTLTPDAHTDDVLTAMERHPHGSVADSFGSLDLGKHGFDLLIDAVWVHHPGISQATWPRGWSLVEEADLLDEWSRRHEYAGVLTPAVLCDPQFHVLVRLEQDEPVAGAVVHDAGKVAGISNLWSCGAPLNPGDVTELLCCAGVLHPGLPVTDHAFGDELDVMLAAGFCPLGVQRVWSR